MPLREFYDALKGDSSFKLDVDFPTFETALQDSANREGMFKAIISNPRFRLDRDVYDNMLNEHYNPVNGNGSKAQSEPLPTPHFGSTGLEGIGKYIPKLEGDPGEYWQRGIFEGIKTIVKSGIESTKVVEDIVPLIGDKVPSTVALGALSFIAPGLSADRKTDIIKSAESTLKTIDDKLLNVSKSAGRYIESTIEKPTIDFNKPVDNIYELFNPTRLSQVFGETAPLTVALGAVTYVAPTVGTVMMGVIEGAQSVEEAQQRAEEVGAKIDPAEVAWLYTKVGTTNALLEKLGYDTLFKAIGIKGELLGKGLENRLIGGMISGFTELTTEVAQLAVSIAEQAALFGEDRLTALKNNIPLLIQEALNAAPVALGFAGLGAGAGTIHDYSLKQAEEALQVAKTIPFRAKQEAPKYEPALKKQTVLPSPTTTDVPVKPPIVNTSEVPYISDVSNMIDSDVYLEPIEPAETPAVEPTVEPTKPAEQAEEVKPIAEPTQPPTTIIEKAKAKKVKKLTQDDIGPVTSKKKLLEREVSSELTPEQQALTEKAKQRFAETLEAEEVETPVAVKPEETTAIPPNKQLEVVKAAFSNMGMMYTQDDRVAIDRLGNIVTELYERLSDPFFVEKIEGSRKEFDQQVRDMYSKYMSQRQMYDEFYSQLDKDQLEDEAFRRVRGYSTDITLEKQRKVVGFIKELYPELRFEEVEGYIPTEEGGLAYGSYFRRLIRYTVSDAKAETVPHELMEHVVRTNYDHPIVQRFIQVVGKGDIEEAIRNVEAALTAKINNQVLSPEQIRQNSSYLEWWTRFWEYIKNAIRTGFQRLRGEDPNFVDQFLEQVARGHYSITNQGMFEDFYWSPSTGKMELAANREISREEEFTRGQVIATGLKSFGFMNGKIRPGSKEFRGFLKGRGVKDVEISFLEKVAKSEGLDTIDAEDFKQKVMEYLVPIRIRPLIDIHVDRLNMLSFDPAFKNTSLQIVAQEIQDYLQSSEFEGVSSQLKAPRIFKLLSYKYKDNREYLSSLNEFFTYGGPYSQYAPKGGMRYKVFSIDTPYEIFSDPHNIGDAKSIGWVRLDESTEEEPILRVFENQPGESVKEIVEDTNKQPLRTLANLENQGVVDYLGSILPHIQDYVNKAVLQWAAGHGYEKIRFATGETAAKVEGHMTIAEKTAIADDINEVIGVLKRASLIQEGIWNENTIDEMIYDIDRLSDIKNRNTHFIAPEYIISLGTLEGDEQLIYTYRNKAGNYLVSPSHQSLLSTIANILNIEEVKGTYFLDLEDFNILIEDLNIYRSGRSTDLGNKFQRLQDSKLTAFQGQLKELKKLPSVEPLYNALNSRLKKYLKKKGRSDRFVTDQFGQSWLEFDLDLSDLEVIEAFRSVPSNEVANKLIGTIKSNLNQSNVISPNSMFILPDGSILDGHYRISHHDAVIIAYKKLGIDYKNIFSKELHTLNMLDIFMRDTGVIRIADVGRISNYIHTFGKDITQAQYKILKEMLDSKFIEIDTVQLNGKLQFAQINSLLDLNRFLNDKPAYRRIDSKAKRIIRTAQTEDNRPGFDIVSAIEGEKVEPYSVVMRSKVATAIARWLQTPQFSLLPKKEKGLFKRSGSEARMAEEIKASEVTPSRILYEIQAGSLKMGHEQEVHAVELKAIYKEILGDRNEADRKLVTKYSRIIREGDVHEIDKLQKENPTLFNIALWRVAFYERYRERIKSYYRLSLITMLPNNMGQALVDVLDGMPIAESVKKNKIRAAYKKAAKTTGLKFDKMTKEERQRKTGADFLTALVEKYNEIDNFGPDDYLPRVEFGAFHIVDKNGVTVALAHTEDEAVEKAIEFLKKNKGEVFLDVGILKDLDKGKFSGLTKQMMREVRLDLNKSMLSITRRVNGLFKDRAIKPKALVPASLKASNKILEGESDAFKADLSYVMEMEKALNLNLPILKYSKHAAEIRERDRNAADIIEDTIKEARGRYYVSDKIFDSTVRYLQESKGWLENYKPRSFGRGIGHAKKVVGAAMLGYKIVAAGVNRSMGVSRILGGAGIKRYVQGRNLLATEQGKQLIDDLLWSEGLTIDVERERGIVGGKETRWYHPTGLFKKPERPNRRESIAAMYIVGKLDYGLDDTQAREFAIRGMWFLQNIYNAPARIRLFRGNIGSSVGMFRNILVNEIEVWRMFSAKQKARYAAMYLMLVGPIGIVHLLRALLPFGWGDDDLDKLEIYFNENFKRLSRGIPGVLFDIDIVKQLLVIQPQTFTEFVLGPLFGKMYEAGKVFAQMLEGNEEWRKNAFNYIARFASMGWYWYQIVDAFTSDDGAIHDMRTGGVVYKPDLWDYMRIALGAPPIEVAIQREEVSKWYQRMEKDVKNASALIQEGVDFLDKDNNLRANIMAGFGLDASQLNDSYLNKLILYNYDPGRLGQVYAQIIEARKKPPEIRIIEEANILRQEAAAMLLGRVGLNR